jgi:hypothetical protein
MIGVRLFVVLQEVNFKELLQADALSNPEHFRVHVQLVFQNAYTFNLDSAPVFLYAKRLEAQFDKMWDGMIARWKQEGVSH